LVEPADQRGQDQPERQRVEHGARVYTTDPISGPQDPRPSNETIGAPIWPDFAKARIRTSESADTPNVRDDPSEPTN
jgi:hypothetical protein